MTAILRSRDCWTEEREKKVQSHFKSFENLGVKQKRTSKVGEKTAGDFFDPCMAADWKLSLS